MKNKYDQHPDKYDVGYGKPPKNTQFKPGQSGNPRGRKKTLKNTHDYLEPLLNSKVKFKINGEVVNKTNRELIFQQLVLSAAKGHGPSIKILLNVMDAYQPPKEDPDAAERRAEQTAQHIKFLDYVAKLKKKWGEAEDTERRLADMQAQIKAAEERLKKLNGEA